MKPTPCPQLDSASLFVFGGLSPSAAQTFEEHVRECPECRVELGVTRDVAARLDLELARADLARGVDLPAGLGEELRRRVAAERQPWRAWQGNGEGAGVTTVRARESAWRPTSYPGIRVKPLSVDSAQRSVTMLVQMDPGASYPAHRHAAREECYVLAGDLDVAGQVMESGDYQVAAEASVHGVQSTRGGCTLLIVSSQDDELIG